MKKIKRKFKSEVHLGLLAIILALLSLNVISNFVIYKARESKRDSSVRMMNQIAVSIDRNLGKGLTAKLSNKQSAQFKKEFELKSVYLIPSLPAGEEIESRRLWFHHVAGEIPPKMLPQIGRSILAANFKTLIHADGAEYYYVFPIDSPTGKKVLLLSKQLPELAFYERSSSTILIVSLFVVLMLVSVYFWLFRSILAPFRKLKRNAIQAGREVSLESDDVEEVVLEYQKIIDELKEKESQLTALNQSIQNKADSLESYNKYLLDSMVAGIMTFDISGKLIEMNRSAEKIFALSKDIYLNRDSGKLIFISEEITTLLDETLLNGSTHPYAEYELLDIHSQKIIVGVTVSPIYDNFKNRIGASALFSDVSELIKLRDEVNRKSRLMELGEMAGGLAHQLRNSLGAILGYSNLVKRKLPGNSGEAGYVSELQDETREAESLIARFLNITKPFDYNPSGCDIRQFISELIENSRVKPLYENIEIVQSHIEDIATAYCDSLLLKQAVTNILDNSAKAYNTEPGKIDIAVSTDQDNVIIEISDKAGGIPKKNLEKIFTPFFSTNPSGTGLGLPLAKKIIDLHNGRLSVESEFGIGSRFTIFLPSFTHKIEKNENIASLSK